MKTMRLFLCLALLMTAAFAARAVPTIAAGPFYYPVNGHTYYLASPDVWSNSEAFALTLGGHLASLNDAAENSWVYNNVNILPYQTGEYNAWIGLYNLDFPSGDWHWTSGEPVSYFNWAPGEPNFPQEKWGHYGGPPEKWNNLYWDIQLYGVIEVPEPSTLSLGLLALFGGLVMKRRARRTGQGTLTR